MSPLRGADSAVRNGIRFGDRNQPLEYWIRKYDRKLGRKTSDFQRISARDDKGRPKILHVFQQIRPTQSRGIPYFAPVLTYFKDLADYLEAEIVAARIAACLAVFISKQDPMGLSAATGTGTETTTGKRIQGIEPGMVGYLGLNEEIKVVDPKRPGDAFPAFVETMFRIIGVSLGLPYELIAKDFSKTTYSSARASLLEGRRMFKNVAEVVRCAVLPTHLEPCDRRGLPPRHDRGHRLLRKFPRIHALPVDWRRLGLGGSGQRDSGVKRCYRLWSVYPRGRGRSSRPRLARSP
jgi:lambda family phage portal protein